MRWLLLGFTLLPLEGAVFHFELYNGASSASNIVDQITGADMAGMQVTALFAGFSVSAVWQATGPTSGAVAANPVFSLSLSGNTDGNMAWQYTSLFPLTLTTLVLDGRAAGVFFDRTNPSFGVPGSGPGIDMAFSALSPPSINVSVGYDGPVNFTAGPHDLYGVVTMGFSGGPTIGLPPQNFQFTQDTDRSGGSGEVPEPGAGTMLAIGGALLGVQAAIRRYLRSAAGRKAYMH